MTVRTPQSIRNQANSRRRADAYWTDARILALRSCSERKLSISEAAEELGDGCTKNMVSSKAASQNISFDGYAASNRRRRVKFLKARIEKLKAELIALENETDDARESVAVQRETSEPRKIVDLEEAWLRPAFERAAGA